MDVEDTVQNNNSAKPIDTSTKRNQQSYPIPKPEKKLQLMQRIDSDITMDNTREAPRLLKTNNYTSTAASQSNNNTTTLKRKPSSRDGERRNFALYELESNIERIKCNIKAVNEKRAKRREAAERNLKDELEQLSRQGGNPYEIVREREERERVARLVQKAIKKKEENISKIQARLNLENIRLQKHEERENERRTEQKMFREAVGRKATEEKLSNYIKSRVIHGQDVIDPLGKEAHIHPSKLMIVKDWKFGLGTAHETNPQYMKTIQNKFPNETFNERVVPRIDSESDSDDDFLPGKTRTRSRLKNVDEESDEEYAKPEIDGLWEKKKLDKLSKNSGYKLKALSKLEMHYMEKARERARNNITKKQIVWGKEFTGQPFIPTPAVVLFEDFELENKYELRVILTNVSYTFNTFKLLELENEIKDFFEISYDFPGKMSAGTTCVLNIQFTPRIVKDIDTVIPFLAETGPFQVPLKCLTKKVVISVEPVSKVVDFGSVILAEKLTKTVTIRNSGALDTSFKIVGDAVEIHNLLNSDNLSTSRKSLPRTEDFSMTRVLKFSSVVGYVDKHSTTTFQITFYPKLAEKFESEFKLVFEDSFTEDIPLKIIGQGQNVSIYLEKDVLDMQTCYLNTLYRDVIVVCNRGSISLKCKFKPPPELQQYLEFVPKVGFVQTDKPMQVQVKFKPLPSIYETASGYIDAETGDICAPIQVVVPDQTMPVFFDLKSRLTSSKLIIEPRMIDFGKCSIFECVSIPIKIKNESILCQEFSFAKLPPEIEITPNNGLGTLSCQETVDLVVHFSPSSALDYHFKLTCKTDRNEVFIIPCSAEGVQPPLQISAPTLCLPPVAIDDRTSRSFKLNNLSKNEQSFAFTVPPESYMTYSPLFGTVAPKSSIEIEVKFEAPPLIVQVVRNITETVEMPATPRKENARSKSDQLKAPATKLVQNTRTITEEKDSYAGWIASEEPWSRSRSWLVPCLIKNYSLNCVVMEVTTIAVQASLIILVENNRSDILDFGEIPVDEKTSRKISIQNTSENRTRLNFLFPSKAFRSVKDNVEDLDSPFSIIPPRSQILESGASIDMDIIFSPNELGVVENYFAQVLSTDTNNTSIRLKGCAKPPNPRPQTPPPCIDLNQIFNI